MPVIPVVGPDGQLSEWALIELQGRFESQVAGVDEDSLSTLGTLVATHKDVDTLQLTVGYHQLEGKKIPLKKPFLILDKQPATQPVCAADGDACICNTHSLVAEGPTHKVIGVIRHKYLFKTRPKALISKPAHRT